MGYIIYALICTIIFAFFYFNNRIKYKKEAARIKQLKSENEKAAKEAGMEVIKLNRARAKFQHTSEDFLSMPVFRKLPNPMSKVRLKLPDLESPVTRHISSIEIIVSRGVSKVRFNTVLHLTSPTKESLYLSIKSNSYSNSDNANLIDFMQADIEYSDTGTLSICNDAGQLVYNKSVEIEYIELNNQN